MQSSRIIWISVLVLMFARPMFGQVVVSNANMKILVEGITNRLEVAATGIKRNNLLVFCKDFPVVDSAGNFYIKIPKYTYYHIRKTKVYVGDKTSRKQKWIDSIEFRVKQLPQIEAQLGTLPADNAWSKGEIQLQRHLYAIWPDLWISDIKATVVSYRFNLKDYNNLRVVSSKINGRNTAHISRYLNHASPGSEIIFDSIVAMLDGNLYDVKPIKYTIKGKSIPGKGIVLLISEIGQTVVFKGESTDINWNDFPIKRNFYLRRNDTVMIMEQRDSFGEILQFKRYYDSIPNGCEILCNRVSDTSFYLKYFNFQGTCLFEGLSLEPLLNYSDQINMYYGHKMTFLKPEDSLRFVFEKNGILPFGQWRFYHPNGQLFAEGKFDVRKKMDKRDYEVIMCGDVLDFNYFGHWLFYNTKGELIRQENYKLRY